MGIPDDNGIMNITLLWIERLAKWEKRLPSGLFAN
jgi:hypothetical protein